MGCIYNNHLITGLISVIVTNRLKPLKGNSKGAHVMTRGNDDKEKLHKK